MPLPERLKTRYKKFRAHGHYVDKASDSGEMKPARVVEAAAA
jgi:hypothetical protein